MRPAAATQPHDDVASSATIAPLHRGFLTIRQRSERDASRVPAAAHQQAGHSPPPPLCPPHRTDFHRARSHVTVGRREQELHQNHRHFGSHCQSSRRLPPTTSCSANRICRTLTSSITATGLIPLLDIRRSPNHLLAFCTLLLQTDAPTHRTTHCATSITAPWRGSHNTGRSTSWHSACATLSVAMTFKLRKMPTRCVEYRESFVPHADLV